PYPYGFGSFISEWITTLQQLTRLDATIIVPGHGVIERDRTYLGQVIDLLGFVQSEEKARSSEGLSLEDAARKIDLGRFERVMCDPNPFCRAGFKTSLDATIGRA